LSSQAPSVRSHPAPQGAGRADERSTPPGAASEPVLAQTKLHIPSPSVALVQRARLVDVLIAGVGRKLTLVAAPAGSGKTSLLIEWQAVPEHSRSFAWLSLDPADNDAVRFWDCVIAALQTVAPNIGAPAQAMLHGPGATTRDQALPLLVNELATLGRPLVLVLDDYHVIENAQIHREVEWLIERLPGATHLALATRSDPPLPLARLRARSEMTEIRAADLRFSAAEAEGFLNGTLGLSLASQEIELLAARTEGWVAGLQLAGLSLQGRADSRAFIESFAGDDRQIVDYLGFEVLDHQPQATREFLMASSVLERLSGPLCAAVTGDQNAAQLLEELQRANLFVVPLDSKGEWYRYHHLFRDLLRHELHQSQPQLAPMLHERAAAWYRAEGMIHEAIEHATAAGDFAEAIELITAHWYEFLQRGRVETVAGWIDSLPRRMVAGEPNLCLTKAWIGINMGRLGEVDRWVAASESLASSGEAEGAQPPLSSGVASLRAIHRYMAGDVGGAVEAGRHALELESGGPASPWRPVGCPVLGLALHWHGADDDALATLTQAVRIANAGGNHLAAMHASGGLAAIHYERGELADAAIFAAQALALAEEHGLVEHWARSLSLAVSGRVLQREGRIEEADAAIARALELAQRGVASVEIAYALAALADVRHWRGRREEALALSERARGAVRACTDPGILRELLARIERRLRLPSGRGHGSAPASEELSDAELGVLRLFPSALSQREIGAELYVSINTVKTHTRSIYRKLGVAARDEAVERARKLELI
jgi:LuxR family maltose regulon positive regulatory protein